MVKRTAIVTGITGQDGSYLADLLLEKDYRVYGFKRRSSGHGLGCSAHLEKALNFEVVEGDLADLSSLTNLCRTARADEFYNLGAQSHVGTSFTQPSYTLEASGLGVVNCLEAIRLSGIHTRFYQASTSEMFGGGHGDTPVNEDPGYFHPRSPYGCAKMYGYWITVNYRESYKMFACNGILFNHESPRRGPNFVTRKITMAVARIQAGLQNELRLGNLAAKRDWGHSKDFVRGMWQMLQHGQPDDYVLATGHTVTVEQFVNLAFSRVSLKWQDHVIIDPLFFRPAEVDVLLGDATKAREVLGWKTTYDLAGIVAEMVDADVALLEKTAIKLMDN